MNFDLTAEQIELRDHAAAFVGGEAIGALAGTEPDAGSDTGAFTTHASRKLGLDVHFGD